MQMIQVPKSVGNNDVQSDILMTRRSLHTCSLSLVNNGQEHHSVSCPDSLVRINVSGSIFVTFRCVLSNFPDSLLGDIQRRKKYWDKRRKEYYFDANRPTFEAILQFYQTGCLQRPLEVPLQTFIEQLVFFEMDEVTMKKFYEQEGILKPAHIMKNASNLKQHVWNLFEFPDHSSAARVMAYLSIMCIVLSLLLMCLESVPGWAAETCKVKKTYDKKGHIHSKQVPNLANEYFLLDNCIMLVFAVEYSLRLWSCPSTREFIRQIMNILDGLAVFLHLVFLLVLVITDDCYYLAAGGFLAILRFARVCRIAKLTRYNVSMQLVVHSFKESFHYLLACFYLIFFCTIIFAFLLYLLEMDTFTSFGSIEEGLWWAFASMTTVGYGDVVPKTTAGRTIGSGCILVGFLIISLPSAIIVTNYNRYYRNVTGRGVSDFEMSKRRL